MRRVRIETSPQGTMICLGISYYISIGRIYMTVQATALYFMIKVVGTTQVEEVRNNPTHLDNVAREELQQDQVMSRTTGGVVDVEEMPAMGNDVDNLRHMFENINANDKIIEADRVDNILAAIPDHSTIDPRMLAGDKPRDWADSQR
jgi:hypothetical protein